MLYAWTVTVLFGKFLWLFQSIQLGFSINHNGYYRKLGKNVSFLNTHYSIPHHKYRKNLANTLNVEDNVNKVVLENSSYDDGLIQNINKDNIIALLAGNEHKCSLLKSLINPPGIDGSCNGLKTLFLTDGDDSVGHLYHLLNENGSVIDKINFISKGIIQTHKNAVITVADASLINICYEHTHDLEQYYDKLSKEGDQNSVASFNTTILGSYFSNKVDLQASVPPVLQVLKQIVDQFFETKTLHENESFSFNEKSSSLSRSDCLPIMNFLDSTYRDIDSIVEGVCGNHCVVIDICNNQVNMNQDFSNSIQYILCKLKKTLKVVLLSNEMFFPKHLRSWLNEIFGRTSVISLSVPPRFSVLTRSGHFDLFDSSKALFSKQYHISKTIADAGELDPLYFFHISDLPSTKLLKKIPINKSLDRVATDLVLEALKIKGITTRRDLIHFSKDAHALVRCYERRSLTKGDPKLGKHIDISFVIASMIDLSNRLCMGPLIREFDLNDDLSRIELPGASMVMNYILNMNLFPTVLYHADNIEALCNLIKMYKGFPVNNDLVMMLERWGLESDDLLIRGIAYINDTSDTRLLKFINANQDLFKIITCNTSRFYLGGSHVIFMRDFISKYGLLSNNKMLSYARGSKLMTFCGGLFNIIPQHAGLLLNPIYMDMGSMALSMLRTNDGSLENDKRSFKHFLEKGSRSYAKEFPAKDRVTLNIKLTKLENAYSGTRDELQGLYYMYLRYNSLRKIALFKANMIKGDRKRRFHVIKELNEAINLTNAIVEGIDNNKYQILRYLTKSMGTYNFSQSCEHSIKYFVTRFYGSEGLLVEPLGGNVYYVIPHYFIKDIIKIPQDHMEQTLKTDMRYARQFTKLVNDVSGSLVLHELDVEYMIISPDFVDLDHYKWPNEIPITQYISASIVQVAKNVSLKAAEFKEEMDGYLLKCANVDMAKEWLSLKTRVPIGGAEHKETYAEYFKSYWGLENDLDPH
ncbi:hypothetical protein BdWA1_000387 [Babesia duncani]|uniref:Uncharacterized protein n=1 Tax=Babesia duncani TaxID=323732 RepID=A0AAD9PM94_9APIC|nr:hypothetical protein BdWA1_000387 [Babesia duncani]